MQVVSGVNSRPFRPSLLLPYMTHLRPLIATALIMEKAGESIARLALKQSLTDRPGNPILSPWCICGTHQWKLGVAE